MRLSTENRRQTLSAADPDVRVCPVGMHNHASSRGRSEWALLY